MQRNLAKSATLDYWESGMDLGLSRDMFDSFVKYQTAMQAAFRKLRKTYGFTIVNGNRPVGSVTKELRKKISALLGETEIKNQTAGALVGAAAEHVVAANPGGVLSTRRMVRRELLYQRFKLFLLFRRQLRANLLVGPPPSPGAFAGRHLSRFSRFRSCPSVTIFWMSRVVPA